jgi:hypothetical protein
MGGIAMNDERISRWMGPLGLLTVVAIFVGFGPLSGKTPGQNASGARVAAYYNTHTVQSWASVYVVGFGLALLILFVSQLRTVLRNAGGGQTFWPNVVYAAGILLVAGIVIAGVFEVVLITAAHNHEFAIVKTMNFVSDNNELGFIFGMALLTLAAGASILLNRSSNPLPKTLGWWSLLVGVVSCLGPLAFLSFLFGMPIWFIATGFVIGTKARRAAKGLGTESVVASPDLGTKSKGDTSFQEAGSQLTDH